MLQGDVRGNSQPALGSRMLLTSENNQQTTSSRYGYFETVQCGKCQNPL